MVVRQRYVLLVVVLTFVSLFGSAVNAQDDGSSVIQAQFNGHRFDIPRGLADGFTAFVIDEASNYPDGADSTQPPRTEFRLLNYTDAVGSQVPIAWVNVFDASILEGYPEYEKYEHLRDLLSSRPDLNTQETLPTLYPYQTSALPPENYTELFMNAAYLDSESYSGITFIYGRVVHLGDSKPILFYRVYFEGISSDNQHYLSAQVEGLQELTEPLDDIRNVDEYITQTKALFHEPADETIMAWLSQANVMFSSFADAAHSSD